MGSRRRQTPKRRLRTPAPAPRGSAFFGAPAALFTFFSFVVFVPLPQIILLRWRDPPTTAFIRARQGRLRAQSKSDAIDRRPLPEGLTAPAR